MLDTKYKKPPKPATSDIAQVVAYAEAAGCHDAILLYPSPLDSPLDGSVGNIRVRSRVFDLKQDLNDAGTTLLAGVGEALGLNLLAQDVSDMSSPAEVTA